MGNLAAPEPYFTHRPSIAQMKIYQVVFRNLCTRNIEADGCERRGTRYLFTLEGDPALFLDEDAVISVEEVRDLEGAEHGM